jgi:hypothetical protein
MTMTQDSGGGGTAANLCPPSPSDLAGQINNLITRIENLEKAVAELQGQDVTATQLSDLSQQVGWVYDVTYLGVPGWTQTASGTLIPPPGLALSTLGIVLPGLGGNPSTLVSTDSDGNPTFSVNNNGVAGGGNKRYAGQNFDASTMTLNSGYTKVIYDNPIGVSDTIGITFATDTFTVPRTGYYFISCSVYASTTQPTTVGYLQLRVQPSSSASTLDTDFRWGAGTDLIDPFFITVSGIIDIAAATNVEIFFSPAMGGTPGNALVHIANLSIIEL